MTALPLEIYLTVFDILDQDRNKSTFKNLSFVCQRFREGSIPYLFRRRVVSIPLPSSSKCTEVVSLTKILQLNPRITNATKDVVITFETSPRWLDGTYMQSCVELFSQLNSITNLSIHAHQDRPRVEWSQLPLSFSKSIERLMLTPTLRTLDIHCIYLPMPSFFLFLNTPCFSQLLSLRLDLVQAEIYNKLIMALPQISASPLSLATLDLPIQLVPMALSAQQATGQHWIDWTSIRSLSLRFPQSFFAQSMHGGEMDDAKAVLSQTSGLKSLTLTDVGRQVYTIISSIHPISLQNLTHLEVHVQPQRGTYTPENDPSLGLWSSLSLFPSDNALLNLSMTIALTPRFDWEAREEVWTSLKTIVTESAFPVLRRLVVDVQARRGGSKYRDAIFDPIVPYLSSLSASFRTDRAFHYSFRLY